MSGCTSGAVARLLAIERHRQRSTLRRAALCAAVFGAASAALLGLSGWFIAAAAAAGAAGPAAAHAFNYLLPSAAIRLLAIARTGSRYGERLFGHEAALLALARVRPALFSAVARSDPTRALSITTGEATASLIQDVGALEVSFVHRSAPFGTLAAIGTGAALLACASWAAVASTALCLFALMLGARMLALRMQTAITAVRTAAGALKDDLAMLSAAEAELRCYGLEARASEHIGSTLQAHDAAQRRHAVLASGFDLLHAVAMGLAACLALGLARDAGAPLAALAALAAAMTVEGAAPLLRQLAQRGAADDAARRMDSILDGQLHPGSPSPTLLPSQRHAPDPAPRIDLCRPVAASLQAGSRWAIVGPSGIGKTILLDTLLGLRAAAPGDTRIGGHDIATQPPDSLRSCFAWLPQDAALLAGTVRENLALAQPGLDETSMWRALHDAALDDRIRDLPEGLDTWIGADGMLLSGGERRRLALARAYLVTAPWLLLDEPTEGLDADLERTVLARLHARLTTSGQGLLVVTHRRAVMSACDGVVSFGAAPSGTIALAA